MEFILEVRPAGGTTRYLPLPESGILTIGRESPADLVIPDPFLSRSHCSLHCADGVFLLADPGSSNGTFVNGLRIRECYLRPRDTIQVGRSSFRFAAVLNGKILLDDLPQSPVDLTPLQQTLIATIDQHCRFALLDGAVTPAVRDLLNQAGVFYQSLYESERALDVAAFGPYLAELPKPGAFLQFLIKVGWGNSWGVFLNAHPPFEDVRRHLRRFLIVNAESGQRMLFRFYDPRVLRVFIPTCEPRTRKDFFGPIDAYFAESESGDTLLRYTATDQDSTPKDNLEHRGRLRAK